MIEEDTFNEKDVRDSHIYLGKTEGEHTQVCQPHPESNVHWLEKETPLVAIRSSLRGSL